MKGEGEAGPGVLGGAIGVLLLRWVLGGLLLFMGLSKAFHPVEFLKQVRAYDLLHDPLALNVVAAGLPWFEAFCGLLLVLGLAVRGTAIVAILMLVPFTFAVLQRAMGLHAAGGLPFCAIKFDCGCGAGEVWICWKLLENALLIGGAVVIAVWRVKLDKRDERD